MAKLEVALGGFFVLSVRIPEVPPATTDGVLTGGVRRAAEASFRGQGILLIPVAE
jgi:hypothetical protein